ncbi:MAG TPA: permease [Bacteroidales bacterium]|jgi:hypothetical protein|nr:permease [Bacteroidales bacterium]
MDHIYQILEFIVKSFIHIWPYLLISIPLAVFVNLSGASRYISKALSQKPIISVFLATAIGAISPFCSCGVIPVITSLLVSGVPLAPVMSFWIASPSMDPEIFFLSTATIGWELSVWRLAATFVISLSAGITTHFLQKRGFFGNEIVKVMSRSGSKLTKERTLYVPEIQNLQMAGIGNKTGTDSEAMCCVSSSILYSEKPNSRDCTCSKGKDQSKYKKILKECLKAFLMVSKFMMLAFFVNALIKFYLPENFINNYITVNSSFSVIIAALIGIPFYTSNTTALPLVSGFLSMGMNPGAILTFLIAGPVTTLPAMMAVWGIVKPKVFFIFLAFGLIGSIVAGYMYNLAG